MPRFEIDYKNPDYGAILERRVKTLQKLRAKPELLPALKVHYRHNPVDFINDWGMTFDPKNVERGLPALIPFILFPRQEEWVDWVVRKWKAQEPGLTEKTRQMGFSWLSMGLSCTLCCFHPGMVVGVGSRKSDYVDIIGDPKSLIQKCRIFMQNLPREFRAGWSLNKNSAHMRMTFPETGAVLAGEAGDNIGRGNTTSIYFVDESAHLEHPQLVEASLSQTTNCRQDISTPNGMGNAFAQRRHNGTVDVFTFHWRDDPRKDDDWYRKQVAELDPVTVAQEIDINYSASVEGILIPAQWVQASIDAHLKLIIPATGERLGALDIADEGRDQNAFVGAHGVVIEHIEQWSGKGSDIYSTVQRAFGLCDDLGYTQFLYDADGLGAGVRGDARVINEHRGTRRLVALPFRGSGAVEQPEGEDVEKRKNKDYFSNAKAQSWFSLRRRFQNTYRWIAEGVECGKDEIISLPRSLQNLDKLIAELSQPTYSVSAVGKIVVDKTPEGALSPNLADALMIRYSRRRRGMSISSSAMRAA